MTRLCLFRNNLSLVFMTGLEDVSCSVGGGYLVKVKAADAGASEGK